MDWPAGFLAGILAAFLLISLLRSRIFEPASRIKKRKQEKSKKDRIMSSAVDLRLAMGPSIVAMGGGTGLSSLLSGMKSFTRNITAVVTVTDEGGSSGRLRVEWGVLPPGDIRNCVVALAEDDNELRKILEFRFDQGELEGHSLGNLILLALTEISGDFRLGVEKINNLLAIRGKVFPVTAEAVTIYGKKSDGKILKGELEITQNGSLLEDLWLEPRDAKPLKEVLRSIKEADMMVLGPGSLFTSILPNLMVPGISELSAQISIPVVLVANLMTQPGETDGFTVSAHIEWVKKYLGRLPDFVLVNNGELPEKVLQNYAQEGAFPLFLTDQERGKLKNSDCKIIEAPFFSISKDLIIRHNGQAVSEVLIKLCREEDPARQGKN